MQCAVCSGGLVVEVVVAVLLELGLSPSQGLRSQMSWRNWWVSKQTGEPPIGAKGRGGGGGIRVVHGERRLGDGLTPADP